MSNTKETIISAGLNLIPYVGGSLASIYNSSKKEKELERLDHFYKEVSDEIAGFNNELQNKLKNSIHDEEYLSMLIEKTSNKVAKEARENKIKSLKEFFVNALLNGVNKNTFSETEFYLETLGNLSETELGVLSLLKNEHRLISVNEIRVRDFDEPYFILASVNKLRGYGLIEMFSGEMHAGAIDNDLNNNIKISPLGNKFIGFCLS